MTRRVSTPRSLDPAAIDERQKDEEDGDHEQDVDGAAQHRGRREAEQPQKQQDDGDDFEQGTLFRSDGRGRRPSFSAQRGLRQFAAVHGKRHADVLPGTCLRA